METNTFDFWLFIAGLGTFLFGMYHLETGLKGLAGKSLKTIIKKFTNHPLKGIATGALVTAILQSSSLVTLLVVAFLGSGLISFKNSLGVVFGANLGTTVTAWIVAALGFKIDVSEFSYPFLAVGTLTYLLMDTRPTLKNLGSFFIGFGLLFLGLDFMKLAIEQLAQNVNFTEYAQFGLWVFVLIGLVITALIQSSSAMIVIVLSALNAQMIDIHQSLSLIIGANIGTTSTLVLASVKGTSDKKRLATANVIFNVVAGSVFFFFQDYLIDFALNIANISEPLMELVLLNTLLNLTGIILFYPFLKLLAKLMKKVFTSKSKQLFSKHIINVNPQVTDLAIVAVNKQIEDIYLLTSHYLLQHISINFNKTKSQNFIKTLIKTEVNPKAGYFDLKQMEDEVSAFYNQIQKSNLAQTEAKQLSGLMLKLRALVYSAKNTKDILKNIEEIKISEDQLAKHILGELERFVAQKIGELNQEAFAERDTYFASLEAFYKHTIDYLYEHLGSSKNREVSVSTITNCIKKSISSLEELGNAKYGED